MYRLVVGKCPIPASQLSHVAGAGVTHPFLTGAPCYESPSDHNLTIYGIPLYEVIGEQCDLI